MSGKFQIRVQIDCDDYPELGSYLLMEKNQMKRTRKLLQLATMALKGENNQSHQASVIAPPTLISESMDSILNVKPQEKTPFRDISNEVDILSMGGF